MKRYGFTPDFRNLVLAARNVAAPRLPLYEHIVGARMMEDVLGVNPYAGLPDPDEGTRERLPNAFSTNTLASFGSNCVPAFFLISTSLER